MVESGPGLRIVLTADIRACLKMHLIIKRTGKQPKQTKTKAKETSAKQLASEKAQEAKNVQFQWVQVAEDAGLTACITQGSKFFSFLLVSFSRTS